MVMKALAAAKLHLNPKKCEWCTGAILSFGPTWETAQPVAYDSMQFKAAEKNYLIHEKELLGIIQVLKKWWTDLLGSPIYVYTDHKTLENFDTQKTFHATNSTGRSFFLNTRSI